MAEGTTSGGSGVSARDIIEPLYRGKFWIQLIGVLAIIGGAVQVLGAIALLAGGEVLTMLPGLIMAALMIWIGLVLMGAARELDRGYRSDDPEAATEGMARLRMYFTIIGVLALIGIVAMLLGFLLAVSLGIGSAMSL